MNVDYQALLSRYDKPGPRYTSYPTAPAWNNEFSANDYATRLRSAGGKTHEPLSLYVHIPYCDSLCYFCGCTTVITQRHDKEEPYVDRVLEEARLVHSAMGNGRPVAQHHWGGGTPTFLAPAMVDKLFTGLAELFPPEADAEISIEVDPRVTTKAHLETLARLGFNRISMGVQDFDPTVQAAIHRVQSFEQTRAVVDGARDLGFLSVNLDLVYGLPHQTPAGFRRTLEQFHALTPDRIACYSYAHVPWLKKHQEVIPEHALPTGADKLALYLFALESFLEKDYVAIGMDHFAKADDELSVAANSGTLHRNFMGYTTSPADDMVSFGMSAISEMDGAFAQNHKTVKDWQDPIDAGRLPIDRGLVRSIDDERRRSLILDLMCRFRANFANHGGTSEFASRYANELHLLEPMVEDGLVRITENAIEVTDTGRLFVRNICMVFDAYLDKKKYGGPKFSRTV